MKIQKRIRVFTATRVSLWPRLAFTILFLFGTGLLLAQLANPLAYGSLRGIFLDITRPVFAALSVATQSVGQFGDTMWNFATLQEQNRALRLENELLRNKELQTSKLTDENRLLRQSLYMVPEAAVSFVTARIIADTGFGQSRNFILNAGAKDGVRRGQIVLAEGFFIGRIQDVSDRAARAVLITDYNSHIPAMIGDVAQQGLMTGDNSDTLRLLHVPQPQLIAPGSTVYTSGRGGGVPAGLPIGRVWRWDGDEFLVTPMANLGDVRLVQIVDYGIADILADFYPHSAPYGK